MSHRGWAELSGRRQRKIRTRPSLRPSHGSVVWPCCSATWFRLICGPVCRKRNIAKAPHRAGRHRRCAPFAETGSMPGSGHPTGSSSGTSGFWPPVRSASPRPGSYRRAVTKQAELALWDRERQRSGFESPQDPDIDLEITGFETPEIEAFLDPGQSLADPDHAGAGPEAGPPVSRLPPRLTGRRARRGGVHGRAGHCEMRRPCLRDRQGGPRAAATMVLPAPLAVAIPGRASTASRGRLDHRRGRSPTRRTGRCRSPGR